MFIKNQEGEKMRCFYVKADWSPKSEYKVSPREESTKRAYRGNFIWKNFKYGITDRPLPQVKPDEVLIKLGACGVCGSDAHVLETDKEGYTVYPNHCKFPIIIGHEYAGEVVEIGSEVKTLKIGDLVCAEEMHWCGECEACRYGMFNQCQDIEETGLSIDGGFAEYVAIKAKYLFLLNDIYERYGDKIATMEAGALVEPTSVAYNGMFIRSGGFQPGGHVVIFGSGPIGLAAISLARTSGAAKIIVFEITPERMKLAELVGADYVYNPIKLEKDGVDFCELIKDITNGFGASMYVEAAGNTLKTYPVIEGSMSINSKTVQIGLVAEMTPIDLVAYQLKGAHIHGSNGHSGHGIFSSVIRLMASGRIDMRKIITSRVPLEQTDEAIKISTDRGDGKVLVSQYYSKIIKEKI